MSTLTMDDLYHVSLQRLGEAAGDWKATVTRLERLAEDAEKRMAGKARAADWAGVNAAVTREFIGKTAKEFRDAVTEATSIRNILRDAHADLRKVQSDIKAAVDIEAPKLGLSIQDNRDGTVTCYYRENPGEHIRMTEEMAGNRDRLQRRINTLIARAQEIDHSVARALKKSHGGDAHNFGAAKYSSLDAAQAQRALEIASLGTEMSSKQLTELNSILKHNATSPEFATKFYRELGQEGTLTFYARMSLDATDGGSGKRLAGVAELQRHMGAALATATDPDRKHHLPAGWGAEFRRLGTQPIELEPGAMNSPYGYQILGGLLRHGNYDPRFLNPIAEHIVQLHHEDPGRFTNNMPMGNDADYGFNPSGKNGAGYVPLHSVLEALGHSPEAAEKFFTDDPTVYRENGSADKGAELGYDYLKELTREDFVWLEDTGSRSSEEMAAARHHGPNAFGHALEAATTGRPYDSDPGTPPVKHSPEAAQLTSEIVAIFGEKPDLLHSGQGGEESGPLHAMRDSLGEITAEYVADFQRTLHGLQGSPYFSYGEAAELNTDFIEPFLAAVGQDPDAYASIMHSQQTYTQQLVNEAINGTDHSETSIDGRVGSAVTPGAIMAGIMSEARAEAIHNSYAVADEEFNKSAEEKAKWVNRIITMGAEAATNRSPAAGALIGWVAEDIQASVLESVARDSKDEARNEAGIDFSRGRYGAIQASQEAVMRAVRGIPDIHPDTVNDLMSVASRETDQGFMGGATWQISRNGR